MYKKIVFLLLILFVTGCSNNNVNEKEISYKLDINNTYNEEIIIGLSKDAYDVAKEYPLGDGTYTSMEYILLETDINPITTSNTAVYQKRIEEKKNQINVTLRYNYPEKDFLHESYIYKCFEKYDLEAADTYLEITLSGEFYCLNDFNKASISVKANHEVMEANGSQIEDRYLWIIDKDNYKNVNIHYKIARDYDSMSLSANTINEKSINNENHHSLIIIIVSIVFIVISGGAYFIYRKK